MSEQILDGTGKGYKAKVTEQNRLSTFSIVESRSADISQREGNTFLLASDFVSLTTTGSFNGMMYVKNNSNSGLYIDKIRICGTGTSMNSMQSIITANPTAGTLISDANDASANPANLGSSNIFDGLAYSASADGKTVTDGTQISQFTIHLPGHTIQEYDGALYLPKGSSFAVSVKPGVATTACVEVQCWFE